MFYGFLNKNVEEDWDQLIVLFQNVYMLILFIQFEVLGLVVVEVVLFGVFFIFYDIGGVFGNFDLGRIGILFDILVGFEEFFKEINDFFSDQLWYVVMVYVVMKYSES